ncbi:MAG: hypothetical protein J0H65_01235 [Rhizobiales bacterium]|nr:hypothetical protein [Hyphomicrobiales bacterium]
MRHLHRNGLPLAGHRRKGHAARAAGSQEFAPGSPEILARHPDLAGSLSGIERRRITVEVAAAAEGVNGATCAVR